MNPVERLPIPIERLVIPTTAFQRRLFEREKRFGIVLSDQLRTHEDVMAQFERLEAMVSVPTGLDKLGASNGCTIWVKREFDRPTESHYDVATVKVLKMLYTQGLIQQGTTLVEVTSGSAGRSMAYFCNRLGLKLIMHVPRDIPEDRVRGMKALGADVRRPRNQDGVKAAQDLFKRTCVGFRWEGCHEVPVETGGGKPILLYKKGDQVNYCVSNHAENIVTPRAFANIGHEVVSQLPTGRRINKIVATIGNGSTLKGISEVIRKAFGQDVELVGTETRNAPMGAIRKICYEYGIDETRYEDNPRDLARVQAVFQKRYGIPLPLLKDMTSHDVPGASMLAYRAPFVEASAMDRVMLVEGRFINKGEYGSEWMSFQEEYNLDRYEIGQESETIGNTSAINLWIAYQLALNPQNAGANFLILFYDKRDQYPNWPPLRPTDTASLPIPQNPLETMADYVARVYGSPRTRKAA